MRSANFGVRALKWTFSLMLLGALGGCHWDLFGSDNSDGASNAPAATFTLGGTVSGLPPGAMVTLLDNGADSLSITTNGAYTFATALPVNSSYDVIVTTQPTDFFCKVSEGSGTMPANAVTNIDVICFNSAFTLGGTIQGLSSPGLILANGSATVNVPSGASTFTFPTLFEVGTNFNVTVGTQPTGLVCTVSAGSGTMPGIAVTSVIISCTTQTFIVGGTITGLGANTGLVLANGTDTLVVPANATQFTMPASVALGAQYNVTIAAHPSALNCSLANGSGANASANVTNIAVTCVLAGVESVLYSFAGPPSDGTDPWWGRLLLANDGNFYGMTFMGGSNNDGTVFKFTPAGVETVLWSFGTGNDGTNPYGSLIQGSDGNLYGMTNNGGLYGRGTVFRITPAGVESVLWSFGNAGDGMNPYGTLLQGSDGNFYGVAYQSNAANDAGAVFKITPAGVETVLWTFGNGTDGQYPYGTLIQGSDGNFYGMTALGGVNDLGTIFRITPAGVETVLWSFGGNGDGTHPQQSLTLGTDGNFYGMTISGGAYDWGVVFKFTPSGVETVLHSFGNAGDGGQPLGSLMQGADGNFYGTTELGGVGSGTIFKIAPDGAETVLWSFASTATDATAYPEGDLILGPDGGLYGLTGQLSGAHGFGTIFEFKVPAQ